MNKAFDTKELAAKLAAKGLPILEKDIEMLLEEVYAWTEESAIIHPNAVIKAAVPLALQVIKPLVAKEVDKIDGQEG